MSIRQSVADLRVEYTKGSLDLAEAAPTPILQFETWFQEAVRSEVPEPNAMSLGTVYQGRPSVRIVLLKGFDERGFVFYTNYESAKSQAIASENAAALTFFWAELQRQVRIEGHVERVSPAESDQYYASRDRGSRLGAWASPQSQPIDHREFLEESLRKVQERFEGVEDIPRPPHWGGFRVIPDYLEFWQGRASRLHDRIFYRLKAGGAWTLGRLAP